MGNLLAGLLSIIVQLFIWILNIIISIFKTIFKGLGKLFSSAVQKQSISSDIKSLRNTKNEIEQRLKLNNEILLLSQKALTYSFVKKDRNIKETLENQYLYCKQLDTTLNASLKDINIDISKIGHSDFNYRKEKYSHILNTIKNIKYAYDKGKLLSISENNSGVKAFVKEVLEFAKVENLRCGAQEWFYKKGSLNFKLKLDEKANAIYISAKSASPISHTPSPRQADKKIEENALLHFDEKNELVINMSKKAEELDHYDVYEYFRNVDNLLRKKEINGYIGKSLLSHREATDLEDNLPLVLDNFKKVAPPPADYVPDHEKMHGGKQRWAQISDIERAGMLENKGFVIGKMGYGSYLYTGTYSGHVITIASTRSGKGVGVVIPNLLRHKGSAVILDPKGENYLTTGKRREEMGNKVFYFDPWDIIGDYSKKNRGGMYLGGNKAFINPLDMIGENDPDILDKANMLASSMIVREGDKDSFFYNGAELLLTRIIIYICTSLRVGSPRRNLAEVRELLTADKNYLLSMVDDFCRFGQPHPVVRELRNWLEDNFVSRKNNAAINFFQFAQEATDFMMSDHVQKSLAKSNLDILSMKRNPMSIYLILDMNKLTFNANYYKPLIRLIITTCMMGAAINEQPKDNVLFMLDEIAQLGTLQYLPSLLTIYAGKGVVVWTIWQNLSQLKKNYEEDWSTILGNCSVQQFFGVNDQETAEYVSKMAGSTTIYEESFNTSQTRNTSTTETEARGDQYSSGTSDTSGSSSGSSYQGFNYGRNFGKSSATTITSNYTDSYNFSRSIQIGFSETSGKNLAKKTSPLITSFEVTTGNAYDVQFVFYMSKCPYPILSGKIKYYQDKEFYGEYTENLTRI